MTLRKGIYVVPTDRWYIERTVWLIAVTCVKAMGMLAEGRKNILITAIPLSDCDS